MPEFNTVAILLLIALVILWNLDFVATLLTLGSLKPELPEEFVDTYNPAKYSQSQEYTRATSRFSILSSIVSLTILLCFWFSADSPGGTRARAPSPLEEFPLDSSMSSASFLEITF